MQLVLSLTGLIRNKILTVKLGPAAFGEFTQIISAMSVVYVLVSFGMGVGLSRNVAKSEDHAERQKYLSTANTIIIILSFISFFVVNLMLFNLKLYDSLAIRNDATGIFVILILCVAIPFEALKNNYIAFLQGILDIKGLASKRSLAVIIATLVSIPIVWIYGFIGAAFQFLILSSLLTLLLHFRCRKLGFYPLKIFLNKEVAFSLGGFGLVSLVSGFSQSFADAAIRANLIKIAGVTDNGILQSGLVLSQTVKSIVLGSIGSYALATIAKYKDPVEISHNIDQLLKVVLPVAVCFLGILGILSVPILWCLYSLSFVTANQYFPFMLAGDLLITFVWVIGAPLLAFGDRILWLSLDLLYTLNRWLVAMLLIPHVKGLGYVYGYFIAAFIHLLLILIIFKYKYRLHLTKNNYVNLAGGVILTFILAEFGIKSSESILYMLFGLFLVILYCLYFAKQHQLFRKLQPYTKGEQ